MPESAFLESSLMVYVHGLGWLSWYPALEIFKRTNMFFSRDTSQNALHDS